MDSNLQKYQAFVTTVDCGSFTKAAQTLDYSQSSISKMIADLESEWHITLLERSRTGVQLTSDGAAMLPYARKLLDSYHKTQEQAAALSGLATGLIRIGTFSSVATHWVPKIISRFQKDYPGIRYELLLGDYREINEWIMTGRVDCGFVTFPVSQEFESIYLETDEYAAVLPKRHPLSEKQILLPDDLNGQPFMLLEHGGKTEVSDWINKNELKPDICFTTWDDYSILSMVESGLGIGILPKLILRRIPYYVEIREFADPPRRKIGLAMRGGTASIAVKKFVQYLKFRNER